MLIILIFFALFLLLSTPLSRSLPIRVGYFADQISERTLALEGASEIKVRTKNCVVYLLENTESLSEVSVLVSAARSTNIDISSENDSRSISVESEIHSIL